MKKFPLQGDAQKSNSLENFIFQNAFGIPIELDAAPTTAGGQLPLHGDSGFFGTNLYINLQGTVYRFSGTAV